LWAWFCIEVNDSERVEEMGGTAVCGSFFGMSDFKRLVVWQKAHALALHAHRAAMGIRESRYASLRSQIIRSAMSIPTNIVEGRRQESERDFARFLRYSLNSAYELEYHLMFAREIDVIPDEEARSLLEELVEVRRMLHGLLKRISPKDPAPKPSGSGTPV
jgi:four helix bundle protein